MPLHESSSMSRQEFWYPDIGLGVILVPAKVVDDAEKSPFWITSYREYIDFRNWRYLRKRQEKNIEFAKRYGDRLMRK